MHTRLLTIKNLDMISGLQNGNSVVNAIASARDRISTCLPAVSNENGAFPYSSIAPSYWIFFDLKVTYSVLQPMLIGCLRASVNSFHRLEAVIHCKLKRFKAI